MTHRDDIQILRGIAVLLVVLYHLQINIFKNGFLGVDIFFVLSGYLMAQLYDKSSIITFYARRIKRIIPAYLVTISITTFVLAFIVIPADFAQRLDRVWYDLLGLSNIAFWLESSYFDYQDFKPLLNLWSLGVEFQYYLIVPFLLPILRKKNFLILVIILGLIIGAFLTTTISPKTSFFMMPLRIWEFLIGAIVAWISINNKNKNEIFITLISMLILISVILFYPLNARWSDDFIYGHPGIASLVTVITTAIILRYPFPTTKSLNQNIFTNLFIKIGDYSYSIYLVHFPIIVIFNYQPFTGTNLNSESFSKILLIIATIVIFSILMFKYVESRRNKTNFKKFFFTIIIFSAFLITSSKFISNWTHQNLQSKEKLIFNAYIDQDTFRCGNKFRILNPTKAICPIGDSFEDNKKVLLLGDSHANSLKTVFVNTMEQYKISSYFYASNYPLMKPNQNAKNIYDNIVKSNITDVIIHYNPKIYKLSSFYSELNLLLNNLKAKKINVTFIAPVPIYNYHIPKKLYEKLINATESLKTKSINEYSKDNELFSDFIKGGSAKYLKVYLPVNFLCPDGLNCLIDLDDKPLYFDTNHLTITGAKALKPIFNLIAEKIVKKKK